MIATCEEIGNYILQHHGYGKDIKKQLANIKNKIAQMCTRNNVKIK